MGQKRSYKQYPKEFKDEAITLVHDEGYSVPEAAKSLGVASNLLYHWKEQLTADKRLTKHDRVEIHRLRK